MGLGWKVVVSCLCLTVSRKQLTGERPGLEVQIWKPAARLTAFPKWGQRNRILSSSEFREPVLYPLVGPLGH